MDIEEFFGEQFHQWRERFRYYEMAITELESDLGIIDLVDLPMVRAYTDHVRLSQCPARPLPLMQDNISSSGLFTGP